MTLVDHNDRPRPERKPLPSKEQIHAITDIPALEALQEEIGKVAAKIEVDLDYEVGDEDWDARARGALAAHRICMGHIGRHLEHLRKAQRPRPAKDTPDYLDAKARKREAGADKQRALAEASKAAKEHKQVKLAEARLELIDRTTFQGFFMRSASKLLTPEMYDRILADAQLRHANACRSQITLPRTSSQDEGQSTDDQVKDIEG